MAKTHSPCIGVCKFKRPGPAGRHCLGCSMTKLQKKIAKKASKAGREEGAAVVSGWFEPGPRTDFETAMGATVLPDLSDVDPLKFLPSSRSVAFLKTAWQAVGGYPVGANQAG